MKIIVDNFYDPFDYEYFAFLYHRFRERKETAQTWAWLLVLMFIPVVGFILYIFRKRDFQRENL